MACAKHNMPTTRVEALVAMSLDAGSTPAVSTIHNPLVDWTFNHSRELKAYIKPIKKTAQGFVPLSGFLLGKVSFF